MKLRASVIRTFLLSIGSIAGHTVRIAHSVVGLTGAALMSWGAAMIYTPAGWITGGAFLLWLANDLSAAAGARAVAAQRAQQGS